MCKIVTDVECSHCGKVNKVTFDLHKDKHFDCGFCFIKNRLVLSVGTLYEPEIIETTMMEIPEKR